MFPVPSRQNNKLFSFNPTSPSQRHHNKSTHLPYFKRFPNSKFLSQERKRSQKFDLKQIHSPQRHGQNRASFFRRQKQSFDHKSNNQQFHQISTPALRPDRDSKKKRLIRQSYQRQNTKIRHKTQSSYEIRLTSISKHKKNKILLTQQIKMTPLDVLNRSNNLTSYEKQQIIEFNQIYYYGQNCVNKKQNLQDLSKADGSYKWEKGDHIYFRYQIIDILGQGSFGEVFKCLDYKRNKALVAVKLVKDNEKYTKQAKTEIKILNYIKAKDPTGVKNCVHLRDFFMFRSRMCMTFDLLSINLYQLIKGNGYYGLPLDLLRRISLQILNAIHFLHKNQIVHADLKPQNILLKQANKSGIKVIDFGSSCFENQTIYTYIQSRYYRAPEVILGLPYNRKIDIWSFACIIAQLHLGYPLFAGDEQHQQMCLIIQVLGLPPSMISYAAKRWDIFFDKYNNIKPHAKKAQPGSKSLKMALQNTQDSEFIDFLNKCFAWYIYIQGYRTIQQRYQALDCLGHPWILKGLPQEIKQQHLKFLAQEHEYKDIKLQKKPRSFSLHNQRNRLIH